MRSLLRAVGLVLAVAIGPAWAADKVHRIGILMLEPRSPGDLAETMTRALNAIGYRDGVATFEVRAAGWDAERLHQMAAELAAGKVDVIVALTNIPGFAAKQATQVVPVVVLGTHAAVETGLVESLVRARSATSPVSKRWLPNWTPVACS